MWHIFYSLLYILFSNSWQTKEYNRDVRVQLEQYWKDKINKCDIESQHGQVSSQFDV